ncbi:hypothetical protein COO91_11273 (plasmid) [Nostoc flagelliforme CCNUN1]|uniref:Uncharacterized protein n=1 Tax=Nostoc flagelliforme CCNUN1 TaxID=2038116 RepID=A0A2K8TBE3_9NOSO|nr:hypothetical protein COO91_11273 [Nostoc flagelliforme CCNUN1]
MKKATIAYPKSLKTTLLDFSQLQTQKIIGLQSYASVSKSQ